MLSIFSFVFVLFLILFFLLYYRHLLSAVFRVNVMRYKQITREQSISKPHSHYVWKDVGY